VAHAVRRADVEHHAGVEPVERAVDADGDRGRIVGGDVLVAELDPRRAQDVVALGVEARGELEPDRRAVVGPGLRCKTERDSEGNRDTQGASEPSDQGPSSPPNWRTAWLR
jgi:hypothetical protein